MSIYKPTLKSIMKNTAVIALSLATYTACLTANASLPTNQSQEVAELNRKYAAPNSDRYPIVVLDKDELYWRWMQANAFDAKEEPKRLAILKQYLQENFNVTPDKHALINIENIAYRLPESPTALPLSNQNYMKPGVALCVVLLGSYNTTAQLSMSRMIGFSNKEIYKNASLNSMITKMSAEEFLRFSNLHELGHCIDRKYFKRAMAGGGDSGHEIHQSEAFAEVFALLKLAQEGKTGVGSRRAAVRTVYSKKMGPYMRANPQNGFGNMAYSQGGVIYDLANVLHAGDLYIDKNIDAVRTASIANLRDQAENLVENHSYDGKTYAAINVYLDEGQSALERYARWAVEMPEHFRKTYKKLIRYVANRKADLTKYWDESRQTNTSRGVLTFVDYESLCGALASSDKEFFFQRLQAERDKLRNTTASLAQQRKRARELNDVFAKLPAICAETSTNPQLKLF